MTALLHGWSPRTPASARATLAEMQRNVRASVAVPRVLMTARGIVERAGPRDEATQARLIREWVADRFKFQKDPLGVELLETPNYSLGKILDRGRVQGDCDDAATLTAALALAVGIPATFTAAAFTASGPWAHVYTVLHPLDFRTGRRLSVEMDITRPSGMPLPRFARTLTVKV